MYNSIIDFIENDTTKIKKILEKYLFAGNTLRFEEDLMHVMIEFGRKIYQECLKEIEENIRQSEFRKKNYYVEPSPKIELLICRDSILPGSAASSQKVFWGNTIFFQLSHPEKHAYPKIISSGNVTLDNFLHS